MICTWIVLEETPCFHWFRFRLKPIVLTHTQLETHGYIINTVAPDVLQAINIYCASVVFIAQPKINIRCDASNANNAWKFNYIQWTKIYAHFKLIEAAWCKHESVQHIHIALDNGSSPIRRPGIIWTNAVTSSIRPKGKYFSEFLFKIQKVSFQGNAPEVVVCEMAVILSRPQCVNSSPLVPHISVSELDQHWFK